MSNDLTGTTENPPAESPDEAVAPEESHSSSEAATSVAAEAGDVTGTPDVYPDHLASEQAAPMPLPASDPESADVPETSAAPGLAPEPEPAPPPAVSMSAPSESAPVPTAPAPSPTAPAPSYPSAAGSDGGGHLTITPMVTSPTPASFEPSRTFSETGRTVSGPFLAFFDHYGLMLCGQPLTDVIMEDGVRRQYFQHLALEEHVPGRVRLLPLGERWLAELRTRQAATAHAATGPVQITDLTADLPRHPARSYPQRPLADIRYLVLHHTGAAPFVGPREIATEHVEANGWPGIGYHFVVDPSGTVYRTQDLTTVSYHARQFNPVSVGVALMGDFAQSLPTADQLDHTAGLLAKLLADLGLAPEAVRGHGEVVPTACPGEQFLGVWKPRLMRTVAERLGVTYA